MGSHETIMLDGKKLGDLTDPQVGKGTKHSQSFFKKAWMNTNTHVYGTETATQSILITARNVS